MPTSSVGAIDFRGVVGVKALHAVILVNLKSWCKHLITNHSRLGQRRRPWAALPRCLSWGMRFHPSCTGCQATPPRFRSSVVRFSLVFPPSLYAPASLQASRNLVVWLRENSTAAPDLVRLEPWIVCIFSDQTRGFVGSKSLPLNTSAKWVNDFGSSSSVLLCPPRRLIALGSLRFEKF